jgi:HrpA-like RNA helicase
MLYDLFVAIDSLIQDPASLRKQPSKIQLFAPPTPPQSQQAAPPPAPVRISNEAKAFNQRKSKKRQQGGPNRRTTAPRGINREAARRLSELLTSRRQGKEGDKGFQQMLKSRATLPAHKEKENVLRCVRDNQVVLVCGQTGCGKTTQVPQFILDEYIDRGAGGECQIICTQPRRIAAIGVATRVAQERCEQIADIVGYQIRMDAKKSANTRLLFCTTGVLLRRLLTDRALSGVSLPCDC